MMRFSFAWPSIVLLLITTTVVQADEMPTEEDYARIQAALAEMECEMDQADIHKVDDGFELKNVICADEQNSYEIQMNDSYEVLNKHKE